VTDYHIDLTCCDHLCTFLYNERRYVDLDDNVYNELGLMLMIRSVVIVL